MKRRDFLKLAASAAPLAETLLLGNMAARAGRKRLAWDGGRIVNDAAANAFLSSTPRSGWGA